MLKHYCLQGMDISCDDEQNSVILNHRVVRFGPNQYTLLKLLLAQPEVRDDDLSLALYQHNANGEYRALLTRTIAKVRLKLTTPVSPSGACTGQDIASNRGTTNRHNSPPCKARTSLLPQGTFRYLLFDWERREGFTVEKIEKRDD